MAHGPLVLVSRLKWVKVLIEKTNSEDVDQTTHKGQFHLGLQCFRSSLIKIYAVCLGTRF